MKVKLKNGQVADLSDDYARRLVSVGRAFPAPEAPEAPAGEPAQDEEAHAEKPRTIRKKKG